MSDLIDDAQQLEAEHLVLSLAAARAAIPAGQPGECANCGDEFPRLVGGLCGFCRDGRRPLIATTIRPALPSVSPIISEEEVPVPSPQYAKKVISVPIESAATLLAIEQFAADRDLPLGRATAELAERGLAPQALAAADQPPAALDVRQIDHAEMLAELGRRVVAAPALVDAALARADAAERQLATLREQLRGLVGEG